MSFKANYWGNFQRKVLDWDVSDFCAEMKDSFPLLLNLLF